MFWGIVSATVLAVAIACTVASFLYKPRIEQHCRQLSARALQPDKTVCGICFQGVSSRETRNCPECLTFFHSTCLNAVLGNEVRAFCPSCRRSF